MIPATFKTFRRTCHAILASGPSCPRVWFPAARNVDEVNQRRSLEESGQWLENVDRTHLILVSGKLVLQKLAMLKIFERHHIQKKGISNKKSENLYDARCEQELK